MFVLTAKYFKSLSDLIHSFNKPPGRRISIMTPLHPFHEPIAAKNYGSQDSGKAIHGIKAIDIIKIAERLLSLSFFLSVKKAFYLLGLLLLFTTGLQAQEDIMTKEESQLQDSLYILEVEASMEPLKILHAEPLYIDLIRDLGARKGEREWNVGLGMHDKLNYDSYEALVEYEWAPINRLGLEIEVPVTIYMPNTRFGNGYVPSNRIESLQTAAQYTFLVSDKWKTSMAIGYLNELLLTDLNELSMDNAFSGNLFNPFFIVARRWGYNFHSLIYTGPRIQKLFHREGLHTEYEMHTSFHYMLSGTRNFIGVEFNKELAYQGFDMVIRPQMRLEITHQLLIGIVTGIPISRENERLSTFMRLIYEPRELKPKR